MPWKQCSVMDERMQFVTRRLAELCAEFGISRKTGYKIFDRYQECDMQGRTDRSRRPHHYAHKPASPSGELLQQQARFNKFIEVFNQERPHEALDMKCPADVY